MIFGPWMKYGGHPLALGLLFGAVVGALTGLMRLFAPGWDGTPLVLLCVLATLAGYYSYHFIQHSLLRVSGAPTFRLVEAAVLLLLLQLVMNAGEGRNPLAGLPRFDYPTLLASGLLLFVWLEAGQTARDLDQLGEPPDPGPNYVPPSERLAVRFFGGGALLLIATGLGYVGLRELLDLSRLSAVGVLPNVLLYFLLGTAMLAQIHYALQHYRWQEQGIAVAPTVSRHWTGYSLAFLGVALLLAALLPTRYTLGLLDALRAALGLLILAAQSVVFLILYAFMWLLSQVLPAVQAPSAPVMPAAPLIPPAPPSPDGAGGDTDWLGLLRSLIFWAVVLAMLVYLLRTYLAEHPRVARFLAGIGPLRLLRHLWRALLRRVALARRAALAADRRAEPASPQPGRRARGLLGLLRPNTLPPREQVLYYYLSLVRHAARHGFPRRDSQTPTEYGATLAPRLPEVAPDVDQLTGAFLSARYSPREVEPAHAHEARTSWQRIRATLRALRRRTRDGEDSSPAAPAPPP